MKSSWNRDQQIHIESQFSPKAMNSHFHKSAEHDTYNVKYLVESDYSSIDILDVLEDMEMQPKPSIQLQDENPQHTRLETPIIGKH